MSSKKGNRQYLMYGVAAMLFGANILFWGVAGVNTTNAGKIPKGVVANGQELAGLTKSQAKNTLSPIHRRLEQQPLTLIAGNRTYNTTLTELGYSINTDAMVDEALSHQKKNSPFSVFAMYLPIVKPTVIPIKFSSETSKTQTYIATLQGDLPSPKDISLDYQNNTLAVIPAENGLSFQDTALISFFDSQITAILNNKTTQITLPASEITPDLSQESQITKAKQFLEKLLSRPLALEIEDVKTELSKETLYSFVVYGVKDNELVITLDEAKIQAKADEIAKKVTITPEAKKISSTDNGVISEGRDGRKLNAKEAARLILDRLKVPNTETPLVLAAEKVDRNVITQGPEFALGRDPGKYIEVDLSLQRLNLIEGTTHVRGFSVSTGKWSSPTPMGEFQVHNHIPTAWSKRYRLYMDFWMAITPNGLYGIHQLPRWPNGAVEGENHIGQPASHGCIRLARGEAEIVYNWASNGTKVFIHE